MATVTAARNMDARRLRDLCLRLMALGWSDQDIADHLNVERNIRVTTEEVRNVIEGAMETAGMTRVRLALDVVGTLLTDDQREKWRVRAWEIVNSWRPTLRDPVMLWLMEQLGGLDTCDRTDQQIANARPHTRGARMRSSTIAANRIRLTRALGEYAGPVRLAVISHLVTSMPSES